MSIPYMSGHPFLPWEKMDKYVNENKVSIPYMSGHPFLPSPSKLLDFMRPPSLNFAGIYQTILTKGLFLGF